MNRSLLWMVGITAPSSLLLLDSAAKGTALLLLAAIAVLFLRRDSAATRHLIWFVAIAALLGLPAMSLLLPRWRVLPQWAGVPEANVVTNVTSVTPPAAYVAREMNGPQSPETAPAASHDLTEGAQDKRVPSAERSPTIGDLPTESTTPGANWQSLLPGLWLAGFALLLCRLMVARWLLGNTEQRAQVLWSPRQIGDSTDDPLVQAFHAARKQLGMRDAVTLLLHPSQTIPVVWGILRYRLLLPEVARTWSQEQLRSVLLHELAHLQRHDTFTQLLAQIACALHWFNPLVWFAAWRLAVERERACDDLVLASGVRPSQYAGHLLGVVTQLSPAAWTSSCGLAMARKSSLESRLSAVLSSKLNRRRVSLVAAALALVIAVGFSVPLAMLRAMEEKAPAEIKSGTTMRKPKHEYAQALWQTWQAQARTDGKIPGALVGQLAGEIDSFLKQHPEDELAPKLAALKKRIDATRDWAQDDVVTLLDDITAISTAPVSWVHLPLEFDEMRNVKRGIPLPDGLKSADWGDAAANGLRTAWLLEPRAEKYPLGSVFKARVLFHNTGKAPIVISIETWRQHDGHTAKNAKDETINVSGTHYTGITPMTSYRLSPGEYCEVLGHGIAIGAGKYEEEFSTGAVGAIIEAKEGDDVRLTHRVSTADGGWTRPDDPKDPNELWKKAVAERVAREAPLPTSAADREQLIRRVTLDVFGEGPSAEEVAAFVANKEADALAKLTAKLQAKPRPVPFTGELFTGETKFRVTATDPDADKKPRTANAPGRYILGENVHLLVSQTTTDSGWTNKATIAFLSPDPKVASPHKPYEIALPDGLLTWGAAWERGKGELWILQKGLARKYDFTDPDAVKETRYDEGGMKNVPAVLHEAFTKIFSVPGAPVQKQQELKPKEGALLEPAIEKRLKWGGPVNGLRGAIVIREAAEPKGDNKLELLLVVQNVSKEPIRLIDTVSAAKIRDLSVKVAGITQAVIVDKEPTMTDVNLAPQAVAYLPLMRGESITGRPAGAVVAEGALKNAQQTLVAGLQIEAPPAGAWKGKLVTGETTGVIAAGEPQPKNEHARDLLELLNKQARLNGDIPGGLIDLLGKKVLEFVRNNTGDTGGDSYAKKMAPLVARFGAVRDWPRAEVVKLLDEVAAAHAIPLQTTSEHLWLHSLRTGTPLPKELATEPWGATDASGLRLAWQLEPKATEHRLGTPLHANILIHNAGKLPVVFRTENWHQFSNHQARDAKGAEIKIESTYWTTLAHLVTYRLAPGEYIELKAAGIGVGAHGKDDEQWQGTRVGSWIEAKAGDEVTFQAAAVPFGDWDEEKGVAGNPDWWLKFVTERLSREQPLPADSQERIRLLDRVVRDLFGVPPTAQEVAAFVADNKPAAFESLAKRLATRSGQNTFRGSLKSGPTKFRVIPVDPDAAKKPRTASNPGRYTLGDNVRLEVSRRPDGTRIVNEATIHFYSADQKSDPPGKPVELKVSDGYNSWAAAWVPRGTVLWVKDTNGLRSYDINDPAKVKVQAIDEPAKTDQVPQAIKEALNAALMPPPK